MEAKIPVMVKAHEVEVAGLKGELVESRSETAACRAEIGTLEENLSTTKQALEDERRNLARALQEFATEMERAQQEHTAAVASLEAKLAQGLQQLASAEGHRSFGAFPCMATTYEMVVRLI